MVDLEKGLKSIGKQRPYTNLYEANSSHLCPWSRNAPGSLADARHSTLSQAVAYRVPVLEYLEFKTD